MAKSSYCTSYFNIDLTGDGEADKDSSGNLIKYYCHDNSLNIPCEVKGSEGRGVQLKNLPDCKQKAQEF